MCPSVDCRWRHLLIKTDANSDCLRRVDWWFAYDWFIVIESVRNDRAVVVRYKEKFVDWDANFLYTENTRTIQNQMIKINSFLVRQIHAMHAVTVNFPTDTTFKCTECANNFQWSHSRANRIKYLFCVREMCSISSANLFIFQVSLKMPFLLVCVCPTRYQERSQYQCQFKIRLLLLDKLKERLILF